MSHSDALHVVLGAGQIATHLTERLLARGFRVRQVRRSRHGGPDDDRIERASGDLTDTRFAREAVRGAQVAYDCTVPPYDQWPTLLLPLGASIVEACAREQVALVAFDNLYMYGAPDGPMTEQSPVQPCSKKGELRAQLAALRLAAHAQGNARVTLGRASDLYGPGVTLAAIFNERFYERLLANKTVDVLGDPERLHSYSYALDVADALVTLGTHDVAFGSVWHLPVQPATSTSALIAAMAREAGVRGAVRSTPRWLLKSLGVFVPIMRELAEMDYQWKRDFVLDDSRFRSTFSGGATATRDAARDTIAWARRRFGAR
jgi:nucleoside-diphosphate-sugar epimerase